MRNISIKLVFLLVSLLVLGISSNSFAEKRYNIDDNGIKDMLSYQSSLNGKDEITWTAWVRNNSDKTTTYNVTVNFLNGDETISQASKLVEIMPNRSKKISNTMILSSSKVDKIDSGYVVVSKIGEVVAEKKQTLSAKIETGVNKNITKSGNNLVELDYNIRLKNNTDKPVKREITIAFLDDNNNRIGSGTRMTSSFKAGESKLISNTILINASDAERISTGQVTIN